MALRSLPARIPPSQLEQQTYTNANVPVCSQSATSVVLQSIFYLSEVSFRNTTLLHGNPSRAFWAILLFEAHITGEENKPEARVA